MGINQLKTIYKQEAQFYLANPSLETIHKFTDVNNRKLTVKYNDLHELSFSIPYKVDIDHELVDNPAIKLVRERFVIKVVLGTFEEHFLINKIIKSENEATDLTIGCFYLPYELHYKRYRSYSATSYNCLQVTGDCLDGTPWGIGYIDPTFNTKYRQFDLSSGNRLDFLNQIGTSIKAIKTYDTKNRLVNFYQEDNISVFKGWNIKTGQYLDGISDEIDLDQMCVRLYCYGNNDLTINNVNPNGQSYIEDFSHFLYPFEIDDNGNVMQHSNYMSDALCKAILDHGELVEQKKGILSGYLNQISIIQQEITAINNKINDDNLNISIVDANLKIATQNNQDTTALNQQRTNLVNDLTIQQSLLKDKNNEIDSIKATINDLKNILVLENYLENNSLAYLLDELKNYTIFEDEFSDDNIIDATDLYNEGLTELAKRNSPPVNISINLIDFLACIEESYNWDKLSIGDLVNIIHPTLGIRIQARITQIDYDFENESISLGISNGMRLLSNEEKVIRSIYNVNRTSTDYTNRKPDFLKTSYNFNTRNDRISETPVDPTFNNDATDITHVKNDNGTVDLTVNWNYPTDMSVNENNIDGFRIYLYSSKNVENITLGSLGNNEISIINPNEDTRKCTIPSVPANLYYYVGVQAYRDVDNDISTSGIILSNISKSSFASCYPYKPEEIVNIQGKLNGITYSVSDTPPSNPQINDIWTDITTKIRKIYTSNGWEDVNSGSANSVGGYAPSITITPETVVVRNSLGDIEGSITGSAEYLNGKSDTAFAQLDSNGKISTNVIPSSIVTGSYTGDGNQLRTISLPFTANLVKVMSTDTSDLSVYICSDTGGYKYYINTSHFALIGGINSTPSSSFGKLTNSGFIVGQDSNLYANKSGVVYLFEAFQ